MTPALLGTDILCLLDEAHTAQPLVDPVHECQFHEAQASRRAGRPLTLVTMTATTREATTSSVSISVADMSSPAGPRLLARKQTVLVELQGKAGRDPAATLVALANAELLAHPQAAIGVVVNTVGSARRVFDGLKLPGRSALVVGRCRPVDRANNEPGWLPSTGVGRSRDAAGGFVLVATQTIEVGVDLDLDILITQSASLDALIQRFGRVDRVGEVGHTRSYIVKPQGDDVVYAESELQTWTALSKVSVPKVVDNPSRIADIMTSDTALDFNSMVIHDWLAEQPDPASLLAASPPAPLPTAATLSWWRRTSPIPTPDEDVSAYLHGVGRWSPTVSVLWRVDLGTDTVDTQSALTTLPPSTHEMVEVSLSAARAFVSGRISDVTDLEGVELAYEAGVPTSEIAAWVRRGDVWEIATASQLRPGDVVVLRSQDGGHDRYGWTGRAGEPVIDLGGLDLAGSTRGASIRLRLSAIVLRQFIGNDNVAEFSVMLHEMNRTRRGPQRPDAGHARSTRSSPAVRDPLRVGPGAPFTGGLGTRLERDGVWRACACPGRPRVLDSAIGVRRRQRRR